MTSFTRRQSIGLLAAASIPPTAAVAVAAAKPVAKPFDLQDWLDTADAEAVIAYHTAKLVEAMGVKDDTRAYRSTIDHENGFILVVGDPNKGRPGDVTGTTAFAEWEAGR